MNAASKPHLLVVDDEPAVLITYQLILEQKGYRVTPASSSQEAYQTLRSEKVDLLVCDLSLEHSESGFEVIESAKRENPLLPSLLITGYATETAIQKAEDSGVPVLFKPIDIQELFETIASLLRNTREQPQTRGA